MLKGFGLYIVFISALVLHPQVPLSLPLKLMDGTMEHWQCRKTWPTSSTANHMAGIPGAHLCWPGTWMGSSRGSPPPNAGVLWRHRKKILSSWDIGPVTTAPSLCGLESGTGSWCVLHRTPGREWATTPRSHSTSSVSVCVWNISPWWARSSHFLLIQIRKCWVVVKCCWLSPSPARDPQGERALQWNLRLGPVPGPLRLGSVQSPCYHHLPGPVGPAGGQHLWLTPPGFTKLPLADQSHAEDRTQQPIRECLAECQQQCGDGAEQPHAGRSVMSSSLCWARHLLCFPHRHDDGSNPFSTSLSNSHQSSCSLAWRFPCWE